MTDPWPLRSSLELGALPTAVPCACVHTQLLLWEWGLNSLAESAERLVSELVTNAVNATAGRDGQVVSLHLSGNATQVLIEVHGADPQPPGSGVPREPSEENAEARRGVLLVAPLSAPVADTSPSPPESLPRRIPRARAKPQAEIVTDLDLLRRLRDHLLS